MFIQHHGDTLGIGLVDLSTSQHIVILMHGNQTVYVLLLYNIDAMSSSSCRQGSRILSALDAAISLLV